MFLNRIAVMISVFSLLVGLDTTSVYGSASQEDDQSQVTWEIFKDRNNLFTIQYPSNWAPSGVAESERYGPIDVVFSAPGSGPDTFAHVEIVQYEQQSPFTTSKQAIESAIGFSQNDPAHTKFEIERAIECSLYTLNGLEACSVIYEARGPEEGNYAGLSVDALAPDGTEYTVFYTASFDVFEHFLPVAENMIKSFQVTANGSPGSDFSLGDGSIRSLDASIANTAPGGARAHQMMMMISPSTK